MELGINANMALYIADRILDRRDAFFFFFF